MDNMEGKGRTMSLRCVYTNADSLANKMDEFEARIREHRPDVIGVTETLPKSTSTFIANSFVPTLHGYTSYSTGEGRGASLFIRADITSMPLELKVCEGVVAVGCIIPLQGSDQMTIGLIYRSPSSTDMNNQNLLRALSDITHI